MKKKKSLVGWTKEQWELYRYIPAGTLVWDYIYKSRKQAYSYYQTTNLKKVRITIEEI